MAKKINLIEYERIVNEKNQRLIFFGRYAGLAGMINSLWSKIKNNVLRNKTIYFQAGKQMRTSKTVKLRKESKIISNPVA